MLSTGRSLPTNTILSTLLGHANTFYNEMGAQYVANVEIPSEASVDDLQGKLQNSLGQDILQGIRFIEVESTGNE